MHIGEKSERVVIVHDCDASGYLASSRVTPKLYPFVNKVDSY